MEKVQTIEETRTFVKENHLAFLYVSQEGCSVCQALRPKISEQLKKYPKIALREVEAERIPEISAEYLVFTAPAILLFVDGKEFLREGKFVQFKKLDRTLEQVYRFEEQFASQ